MAHFDWKKKPYLFFHLSNSIMVKMSPSHFTEKTRCHCRALKIDVKYDAVELVCLFLEHMLLECHSQLRLHARTCNSLVGASWEMNYSPVKDHIWDSSLVPIALGVRQDIDLEAELNEHVWWTHCNGRTPCDPSTPSRHSEALVHQRVPSAKTRSVY